MTSRLQTMVNTQALAPNPRLVIPDLAAGHTSRQKEGITVRYGRLEWPTPDELSADQRKVYDLIVGGPRSRDSQTLPVTDNDGRLYGPFTTMLSRPRIAEIMQMLGVVIRYEL